MNPTGYFRINPKTQYPEDVWFDTRALIINKEFWNSIRSDILEMMKDSGPVALYQIGLNAGSRIGAKACGFSDDWLAAFHSLADYCFDAGWGRIEISDKNFSQETLDRAVLVVRDNFFVQGRSSLPSGPSCYFLSGMIAGIAKGLLHEAYRCVELSCMAAGSPDCRFRLLRHDRE